MSKLFNRVAIVSMLLVAVSAPFCSGDTLSLRLAYDPSNFSHGVGGEFMAYDVNGVPFAQSPKATLANGTFQTFCIEYTEEFTPGSLLYAEINTGARFGGVAGGITNPLHTSETWDPLDDRTAYLYTQFSLGKLSNYDYTYGGLRSDSAGQLQLAIWYLEQEIGSLGSGDSQAKTWVAEADTAVAQGGVWYNKGLGNVAVLNLWTDPTLRDEAHRAQDQLVRLPGPENGPPLAPLPTVATSGILLLGMTGLARMRRRRI